MTNSSTDPLRREDAAGRDADRVRAEYQRRAQDQGLHAYYERIRGALDRASAERRSLMLELIDELGSRSEISILDVGCGIGADLAFFAQHGFARERLAGVDLLDNRVALAQASLPGSDVRVGNAGELPYADRTFDVALQSVVLSSVTNPDVRHLIAAEMSRVVRPGGLLISYDMRTVAGANPELVPIDEDELGRLFGAYGQVAVRTLTLHIGIAARVGPVVGRALGHIPVLRTHLLAVVTRDA